ncbi:hypothetical protein EST38_g8219 [Candolleomyces aberdarensis]|uniref:Uncharacterized protein n=1 Tax=Candolleomyces aberdarensis TaxID=2316362 RepID=A0A4Q2DDQ8_9AGAR|nr:hypothetical protein EST38_g8219 [Candolleomyces aberdarensis]
MRNEPSLIEVLRALAAHSLESLSFVIDALERLRWDTLPAALKAVLHQLVGRNGTVKKLRLWNVELSERLVDELSGSLQSLECVGVTILSSRYRRRDSTSLIPPAHINASNIQTLATWGSAELVCRMCGVLEDGIHSKARPAFPRLKKIVLPSPYVSIERNRVEWIKMNAPKLDSIRLSLRPGQYEEYFNIDRLAAQGPFRHVELYHEIDLRPCLIPPARMIRYFDQVFEPSNLETIIITIAYPRQSELEEPVRVNEAPSLLQILENPFYDKLRRVTFDFRDLCWHHPQFSSQIEPQIRTQLPEGLYKDRFVVELRF